MEAGLGCLACTVELQVDQLPDYNAHKLQGSLRGGNGDLFCPEGGQESDCVAGGTGGSQTQPGLSGGETSNAVGPTPGKSTKFQACTGGAGYFGGGQGAETWGAGGGGSSFYDPSNSAVSEGILLAGSRDDSGAAFPGNPEDPDR